MFWYIFLCFAYPPFEWVAIINKGTAKLKTDVLRPIAGSRIRILKNDCPIVDNSFHTFPLTWCLVKRFTIKKIVQYIIEAN